MKPTVLMILDGFGISAETEGNAIKMAKTPNLDSLMEKYPYALGQASGLDVGLPDGQMGNSEVGHLNIGAGRIVYQELTRITKSIADGDFFTNPELLGAMSACKENGSALHLYGLLSDGGVHSHSGHLYALLRLAKQQGLERVYVHAFLDGRDTPPQSGKGYLAELEGKMAEYGVGKIATVSGRYYAMDRDKRWERVQIAYDALVAGKGETAGSAAECIDSSYAGGVHDEFVKPCVIQSGGRPTATVKAGDSIIFFNFRPDRAREITRCFCDPALADVKREFFPVKYVCFTEYDITIPNCSVAYKPHSLANTLGEYLSKNGKTQLRLAETEKYAHVTFFFNGGVEAPSPGEERLLIPSPKVATYDLQPEMSAHGVTDALVAGILERKYDLIVINYANCDMVGHTGVIPAAVSAVEAVDACVGRVMDALLKTGGQMFLCADHGNSDKMIDEKTGEPFTAHTTSPVPFIIINCAMAKGIAQGGRLSDIAPTLLEMLGMEKPGEMTGRSLVVRQGEG